MILAAIGLLSGRALTFKIDSRVGAVVELCKCKVMMRVLVVGKLCAAAVEKAATMTRSDCIAFGS